MNICLFEKNEINKPLSFADCRAEHILKILHKKEGDSFSAGIIEEEAGTARIEKIDVENKKIFFTFSPYTDERKNGKPLFPLKMIIGFPRPIQLKRLLRDMAGLGVQEIHLCKTELSEKSYLNSKLATTQAGRAMLKDGVEQAAGTHIPHLFMHESLKDALLYVQGLEENFFKETFCASLDNINAPLSLGKALNQKAPVSRAVAAIGSERGWTNAEREMLERFGYTRLNMGSRILRTETASCVAASLILDAMGALRLP